MAAKKFLRKITRPSEAEKKFEGNDDPNLGAYPIDTVLIRQEQRTIFDVLRRENSGFVKLDPEFQRAFVWENDRQSRLIESILMRIPLPVFYLAEAPDGKLIVVDGLQRLATIKRFVNDDLALDLVNEELRGRTFSQLPPKLQNRIEDANLWLYIIDAKAPERVRLDIFERVNSGKPITRQQMRNALYQGPATRFLRDMAESEVFVAATGGSLDYREMRDREAVNRFCAFYLQSETSYNDDMDGFLANALTIINKLTEVEVAKIRHDFLVSMELNVLVFGRHAFRKHALGVNRLLPFNFALFDVLSVSFAKFPEALIRHAKAEILNGLHRLRSDDDFMKAISQSTNSKKSVVSRFRLLTAMLVEVIG